MLSKLFPDIKYNEVVQGLNKFLASPFYIAYVAIMLTISSIFNVGFVFYYIIAVTSVILPALLCDDMTATVPLAVMLNIGINKEVAASGDKVIMGKNLPHFIVMLSLVIIFLFGRLIFDLIHEKERRSRFPRLLVGYILISLAFMFGGIFSKYYSIHDFTFGLREFLALAGFYFYFFYTIDFTKMKKRYFAYLLFFFAMSVSTQILVEAIKSGLDAPLVVGWGNRSGLGGTLVASFTACIYLNLKSKPGISWIYVIFFLFYFTMICLTQCRGAALTGIIMTIPCVILLFVYGTRSKRITTSVLLILYSISMTVFALTNREFFLKCFGRIFNFDFDTLNEYSSGRITIWKTGLDQFIHNPVFGVGWHQIPNLGFPARYHNTIVQLLAATGTVGTIFYLYHRFETVFITLRRPRLEKTFAYMSILCILVSSMLDCFLFNIWLGFEYGFLLAFIEGRNIKFAMKKLEDNKNPNIQVYQTKLYNTTIIIKR